MTRFSFIGCHRSLCVGGMARGAPPGYPLQVAHALSQHTSGFPLLSLAEALEQVVMKLSSINDSLNLPFQEISGSFK
jgi:hypothetical protein